VDELDEDDPPELTRTSRLRLGFPLQASPVAAAAMIMDPSAEPTVIVTEPPEAMLGEVDVYPEGRVRGAMPRPEALLLEIVNESPVLAVM
jgi:hypothetical protein